MDMLLAPCAKDNRAGEKDDGEDREGFVYGATRGPQAAGRGDDGHLPVESGGFLQMNRFPSVTLPSR